MGRFQLAFKYKLILLVASAVIGISILAVVAWQGLHQVAKSSSYVTQVSAAREQIRLLQLELQLLQQDHSEQRLSAVGSEQGEALQQLQKALADEQAVGHIEQLQQGLLEYLESMHLLSEQEQRLGGNDTGLVAEINKLGAQMEEVFSGRSTVLRQLTKVRQKEKEFLLAPNEQQYKGLVSQIKQLERRAKSARALRDNRELLNRYQSDLQQLAEAATGLAQQKQSTLQLQQQFAATVATTFTYLTDELQSTAALQAENSKSTAELGLLIGTPVLALLMALLLSWIGLGVRRNLTEVVQLMERVAAGDLSSRLSVNQRRNDEFDQLAAVANQMADDLKQVITEVVSTSNGLTQMAEQLDQSVTTIAAANETVTGQSNSLAASTEEISITTTDVAKTTTALADLSGEVHMIASSSATTINGAMSSLQSATDIVGQANSSLDELARKSQAIDQVIEMINGLAEQTNLLALNAAIEAARAGDAGRGFAVVADEVRELAGRTVNATSQITDIVEVIQKQVGLVTGTMQQSGDSVSQAGSLGSEAQGATVRIEEKSNAASAAVQQMAGAVSDIADTSREMAERMEDIARNVEANSEATHAILDVVGEVTQGARKLDQLTRRFSY